MEDKTMFKHLQFSATAAVSLLLVLNPLRATAKDDSVTFDMVVSGGAKACLPNATGRVTITPAGPVEIMDVVVEGLPPNSEFDFFVIQLPKASSGVSWSQGVIATYP